MFDLHALFHMNRADEEMDDELRFHLEKQIKQNVARGRAHGYAIAESIHQRSEDVLRVEESALYPSLHRLELRGLLATDWGTSENNRRAKYYRLTAEGRRQLLVEASKWDKLAGAIARIFRPAGQENQS